MRPDSMTRRTAVKMGLAGSAAMALPSWLPPVAAAAEDPTPWRRYPYDLYPENGLVFPTAEGLTRNETDTWYIDAKLVGDDTGREYAFTVIYCKNRVGGAIRADFYQFALYDLETGEYGTFTEYDFPTGSLLGRPKFSAATGHLDLNFRLSGLGATATWCTRRDNQGALVPFAYELDLVGRDRAGRRLGLQGTMDPLNPPTAAGGDGTAGKVTCFAQKNTLTYFQTAPNISALLTWGDISERVTGQLGHIDRQIFPKYAGVRAGLFARDHSHEWRSVNLADGTDLSIWRQFDRTKRNRLQPYTGASRFVPGSPARTETTAVVEVEYIDYVKWPSMLRTAYPAPSTNRYSPSAHILRLPEWDLELTCTPLVPVPAHNLPVEYMIGPVHYEGTFGGRPASGFGVSERTLSLYRDWELVQVLRDTVLHLPAPAFEGTSRTALLTAIDRVAGLVRAYRKAEANRLITTAVIPAAAMLAPSDAAHVGQIARDLRNALPV